MSEHEPVVEAGPGGDLAARIAGQRPGWTLEQYFYTAPDAFRLDLERIFMRHWLFAGALCRLPNRGDYVLYEVAGESIILLRGEGEAVHALFNVCRHRGSRILLEPCGHAERLMCPYHQWIYGQDGRLLEARLMAPDFDLNAFGLHRAQVKVLEGLIFICLAETPPDFGEVEADFGPYFRPYQFDRARIAHVERHVVPANWKLIAENFRECYHCDATHPEYCQAVSGARIHRNPRRGEIEADVEARWRALELAVKHVRFVPGRRHHCARYPLTPGYASWSVDGKPVAPVMGAHRERSGSLVGAVLYPNFWSESATDYATTTRVTPVGPAQTEVEITWYVDGGAEPGRDYEVGAVTRVWSATAAQDMALCANNQAGVNSSRYQPGPYSPYELDYRCDHFDRWYLGELAKG
ncbi:MAG: aromatic ring-hydroxylating dioxygenase subunit alpha [Lentisphaerae bacterium]|nr:aromatic ring-hydroxylating dioxygenase subunit alpha [Lentisphaerota bacterium]